MINMMICLKHKKEFVAASDRQVYSNRDPLKLLEVLNMRDLCAVVFPKINAVTDVSTKVAVRL